MTNKENSRKVIRFLAGGYLAYLAYKIYVDVFTVIQDSTFRVVFFLFATIFLAAGVLLMFSVLRAEYRKFKGLDQQDPDALEEPTESTTETTDSEE